MTPADAVRRRDDALSRDLRELIIELSIGVHRYAMYPPDHPSLERVAENVRDGLALVLRNREKLTIGVTPKQLLVDGAATERKHPVMSDLARRLHAHQLGVLVFSRGVTIAALEDFLATLAREAERDVTPIGLLPVAELPTWEHIVVLPAGYDRIRLEDGEGDGRRNRPLDLWKELVQLAADGAESGTDADPPDGATLARVLGGRTPGGGHERAFVDSLMQLTRELKATSGSGATTVRQNLSELVMKLDPSILRRLVGMVGSSARRKQFVLDASQALASDAVVAILQAAAAASRQTISNSLTRLLSKLAMHSESGSQDARALADAALRENVEALITEWELEDPNPEGYTLLLDTMSRASPLFEPPRKERANVPGATRVLHTALEVDAWGPALEKAVSELLDDGRIGFVLQTLDGAPKGSRVAERLHARLTTPFQLRKLLTSGDVSEDSLRDLVARIGPDAIDPLLDFLTESESRATRRKVFDCLVRLGAPAGAKAVEWLEDSRWFVQRNMLALLQQIDPLPEGFLPTSYLTHPDARVRREGFPLALRVPALRDRALAMAVRDPDERLVRMALLELQQRLPEALVPLVVEHVVESNAIPELRPLGIRTLRGSSAPLALDTLLGICSGGRTIFGRPKLAPSSPELLAALSVLASAWRDDDRAAVVLKRAEASGDADVRAACHPPGGAGT